MQPIRDTSTLDLIFIDMVEYYEIPAILTPLSTSDHNVINWKSMCNIAEKGNLTKIKLSETVSTTAVRTVRCLISKLQEKFFYPPPRISNGPPLICLNCPCDCLFTQHVVGRFRRKCLCLVT